MTEEGCLDEDIRYDARSISVRQIKETVVSSERGKPWLFSHNPKKLCHNLRFFIFHHRSPISTLDGGRDMYTLTAEQVRTQASASGQRAMIKPSVPIQASTAEQKRQITQAAAKVIRTHHDVLVALKNR